MGRTVENTLRPNTKKGITKEQHITPAFIGRNWVGLLKNTLRPNTKKSQRSSTSLNPCFQVEIVGLLNTLKPNTKKGITKEQHITQLFHR
jgi:hypothetical protein